MLTPLKHAHIQCTQKSHQGCFGDCMFGEKLMEETLNPKPVQSLRDRIFQLRFIPHIGTYTRTSTLLHSSSHHFNTYLTLHFHRTSNFQKKSKTKKYTTTVLKRTLDTMSITHDIHVDHKQSTTMYHFYDVPKLNHQKRTTPKTPVPHVSPVSHRAFR